MGSALISDFFVDRNTRFTLTKPNKNTPINRIKKLSQLVRIILGLKTNVKMPARAKSINGA
jgi:hypothetical protein